MSLKTTTIQYSLQNMPNYTTSLPVKIKGWMWWDCLNINLKWHPRMQPANRIPFKWVKPKEPPNALNSCHNLVTNLFLLLKIFMKTTKKHFSSSGPYSPCLYDPLCILLKEYEADCSWMQNVLSLAPSLFPSLCPQTRKMAYRKGWKRWSQRGKHWHWTHPIGLLIPWV